MLLRVPFSVASFVAAVALCAAAAVAADDPSHASPQPSASPSALASPTAAVPTLRWRSIGPAVSGGRVATVAGTDLDPALLYAGAAGGGVWKSTNAGTDWGA